MKKFFFVLIAFVAVVAISCGRSNTKKTEATTDSTTVETTMSVDTTATSVDTTNVQ